MNRKTILIVALITSLVSSTVIFAQTNRALSKGLFENDSVLKITLSGNLRDLMTDKADNPQNHPVIISYMQDGKEISVNAEAKTRGHFRRTMGNCTYPPLLLSIYKK
jgi:hypothetical protein